MLMANFVDDILSNLHDERAPNKYSAADYREAWGKIRKLEPKVTLGIPACIYDYLRDENGDLIMEEQFDLGGNLVSLEKKPAREQRFDVLAILAQQAAKYGDPDITEEQILERLNDDNIASVITAVMGWWGVAKPEDAEDDGETPLEDGEDAPLET